MKRGQVTIFIILAVVILVAIVLVSYYFKDIQSVVNSKDLSLPQDILKIKEMRDNCIETNGALSLYLLGLQGGYYSIPENGLKLEDLEIATLVDEGENKLLNLDEISDEYSMVLKSQLDTCINYPQDVKVVEDSYNTKISFDSNTKVSVDYKLRVIKGDKEYNLDKDLYYTYPIRFREIHSFVESLVDYEIDHPNTFDFSYFAESGMEVNVYNAPDVAVYLVTDYESEVDDLDYLFVFGVRR